MAGENFRIERDSMGEVKVPSEAYYGAQTQRAVEKLPSERHRFSAPIHPRACHGQARCRERQ
jgi:fumarate hydratase class II